jgi:hypothetical protein
MCCLIAPEAEKAGQEQQAPRAAAASSSKQRQQRREEDAAGHPGGGLVGLVVAGWMAVISLILQLLSPVFSLGLFVAQPLTQTNPVRARAQLERWVRARQLSGDTRIEISCPAHKQRLLPAYPHTYCIPRCPAQVTHMPQGFWERLHWAWERPVVKSIRITASIANWSVRLPAIAALLLAQGGAMASTISFPMLAPLLLGTGGYSTCRHSSALRSQRWSSVVAWE